MRCDATFELRQRIAVCAELTWILVLRILDAQEARAREEAEAHMQVVSTNWVWTKNDCPVILEYKRSVAENIMM